eukprot:349895-Chlamydomonas_euryale.AAC.2
MQVVFSRHAPRLQRVSTANSGAVSHPHAHLDEASHTPAPHHLPVERPQGPSLAADRRQMLPLCGGLGEQVATWGYDRW